ncbi:MAG: TonB-dependent receptor, partial [Muribaculaceae bacterium]|nr:TonB-dependent receptor [Muribaculaceae bacterium]
YIYEDEWANPIAIDCGDTPIAFSPDVIVNNSFDFSYKGFEASLQTQYVGKQYMNNAASEETALDAYCVSNLHLNYTLPAIKGVRKITLGLSVYNIFNTKYCNNGYAGAGYTVGDDGRPEIYRYAGYAAQAPAHVAGTVLFRF